MSDSLAIEIISRLDALEVASKASFWSIIIPVAGMFVISLIGWIFTYMMHSNDRKDKYKLALADNKLKSLHDFRLIMAGIISVLKGEMNPAILQSRIDSWAVNQQYFLKPETVTLIIKYLDEYKRTSNELIILNQGNLGVPEIEPEEFLAPFFKLDKEVSQIIEKEIKLYH